MLQHWLQHASHCKQKSNMLGLLLAVAAYCHCRVVCTTPVVAVVEVVADKSATTATQSKLYECT